jgi:dihydroorotate dehydrogenase (NAD+) catalytic subunit
MTTELRGYEIGETYDWNYAHVPPLPTSIAVPRCAGTWDFCGLPLASPLGIPAGPLLNSRWIHHYAALGFDVLTYKTVRSSARASYGLPNLLPIRSAPLTGRGRTVVSDPDQRDFDSWAISFGMPSKDPEKHEKEVV